MLSYKAPFLEAGNLTIFSDDVNADVFYYVCVQPSIMLDAQKTPRLEAFAILPESGIGTENESILEASLVMDVCLAATPKDLALAEKEIKELLGVKPRVLVPAPIHSGKVKLIMAAAGEEPDPKKWFVTSEVNPSILGDNVASLVVRATGRDAKLLIAALDSDVVAASVHYSLEMLGIAPVFKAFMKVNWSKVYHHFEQFDKTNFIFSTDEVTAAVDSLKETSAIQVEIQELDPVLKAEALKSLFNELKTEVLKKLFQPASSPLTASKKVEDRIAGGVSRVLSSIAPGVHHIRRNIDEAQLVETTVSLSQKNVKTYPFYPQSLLATMIRAAGGISHAIKWIKLDEIPFIDQKVELRLSADTFANSNIKSVIMECRVVDAGTGETVIQRTVVFDAGDPLENNINFTRQKDRKYRYGYRITLFMTTASNRLPDQLDIDWQEEDSPYIYFNAASYFETREISVNLDDTSIFKNVHLIQAELTVRDETDAVPILKRTYLFNSTDLQQKMLSIITNKALPIRFDLDLTYFLASAREHKAAHKDIPPGFFFIPNPFENKWSVDIICDADWNQSSKVILETRIRDAERTDPIVQKFDFKSGATEHKLSAETSLNTPREAFEYRVTCLTKEAAVVQGPWKAHEGPILVVSDKIKSERIIRATLTRSPDFEAMEIKQVTVEFLYEDASNGIRIESERLPLHRIGDTVEFRHPMPDFTRKEFMYRQRARSRGGSTWKSDWIRENREKVELQIPDKIW